VSGGLRGAAGRWRRGRARTAGSAGESFDSRLVWLLGSPRSGSTWLMRQLAGHPAVVPVNEPLIGQHLGPFFSDEPGIHAEDLDSGNFTPSRYLRDAGQYFFAEEFRDVWLPALGAMMRARFHAHAAARSSGVPLSETLLVIKEPHGSQAADLIMEALPQSRLLFLLRDGRDVVDSELAAASKGSWLADVFPVVGGIGPDERLAFVEQSAHKWVWRTEVVEGAYAAHQGPKLLVRYEDMRADAAAHLRRAFDWLGLEIADADLEALVEAQSFERMPAEHRGPDRIFRAAKPGLWRESLSDAEQQVAERVMGPKLRELGYETASPSN
jgi:sulfotransferase family protein